MNSRRAITWLHGSIGLIAILLACSLLLPPTQAPPPASPISTTLPALTQVEGATLPATPNHTPLPIPTVDHTPASAATLPPLLISGRLLVGPSPEKRDQPSAEYQLLDLSTGQARTLIAFSQAEFQYSNWQDISPDGSQALFALYRDNSDIYRVDFASAEVVNLTRSPNRQEFGAQWCAGEPAQIFFSSIIEVDCGECSGNPAVMNADGNAYRVLDGRNGAANSDCQSIAYDRGLQPWISRDGMEAALDLAEFDVVGSPEMGSPAWSPDGKKIVWMARFSQDDYAPLLIDLEARSSRILKQFSAIAGHGGWFFPAVWSPDGAYVAFEGETLIEQDRGIWIAGIADPAFILQLPGFGRSPKIWSPGGRAILLGGDGYRVVEVATGAAYPLDLPEEVEPLAWLPAD